jgi:hypothetical protein
MIALGVLATAVGASQHTDIAHAVEELPPHQDKVEEVFLVAGAAEAELVGRAVLEEGVRDRELGRSAEVQQLPPLSVTLANTMPPESTAIAVCCAAAARGANPRIEISQHHQEVTGSDVADCCVQLVPELLRLKAPEAAVRRISSYHNGVNNGAVKSCHQDAGADDLPALQSCIGCLAEHQSYTTVARRSLLIAALGGRGGEDAVPAAEDTPLQSCLLDGQDVNAVALSRLTNKLLPLWGADPSAVIPAA